MEDVSDTEVQEITPGEEAELEMGEDLPKTPSEHSAASSPEPFSTTNEEYLCQICNNKYDSPRVLSCLHVYCSDCLEKQIEREDVTPQASVVEGEEDTPQGPGTIACPECKQVTRVLKGVEDLPEDHVMMNMIDMVAIEEMQIICTSCKAKEKAVARCSDCANFLCPNCVTAHQYMRCFENHKVVSFEDLKDTEGGMSLHKPLFCQVHPSEGLKFFCQTCQCTICNECMVGNHKPPEHSYERIPDDPSDSSSVKELQMLINESKTKANVCQEATSSLDGSLRDLQMQRDDARGLIQETFQTYRTILEKKMESMLGELEDIHSKKELAIMEIFHTIEKVIEKSEDACKFSERVLQNGNGAEILSMKKRIAAQLQLLINNSPKPEVNVNIEFETDHVKFEEAIKGTFGSFKEDKKQEGLSVSTHSSFETEGLVLPPGLLSPDNNVLPVTTPEFIPALHSLPPLSMPGMSTGSGNCLNSIAASIAGLSHQTMQSIASSITNLPSVERSSSRNSYSPAMSDSGISVDAASNSSGNNQPTLGYSSLAKLGSVSVNERGQVTLNGQVIQGLHAQNVTGLPTALGGPRVQTPTTPATDGSLAGLLSSISLPAPPVQSPTPPPLTGTTPSSRSQTPQLTELASLLSQTSPTLGPLSAITGTASSGPSAGPPSNLLVDTKVSLPGSTVVSPGTPMGIPPPTTPTFGLPSGLGSSVSLAAHLPSRSSNKMSAMQIRCKFGQLGPGKSQFNSPHGFCLGMDEDIVVADTNNHRVQVFEKTGEFKYQFGIPGREEGQLWYPRKVAVVRRSGKYVVCDRGNERSRMQIFTKNGHFIKKIAIRYIDIVAGLAVTSQGHIVAVDSVSPTVFVIGESGDLIKWFDCSDYMREPSDIAVNDKEYFVCDFKGHCVVVFNEDGQFVRRIGCENITNYPNGIDISDAGDVLVGDSHGNRFHVAVFQCDGSLIGEFECPYVKVSRCCGLKITSEGYIVTLAKNNHHVLVLNTLYIS